MLTTIIGLQFGDEGKGKTADILLDKFDHIVRCTGGVNAGHSVILNGKKYKFSQLPAVVRNKKMFI